MDFTIQLQVLENDWIEKNTIVRLELPYPIEYKKYVIFVDDDMDPENGVAAEYWGESDWTQVIEAAMYVPEGEYFIYAAVDANGTGFYQGGPDVGDFVGIFGGFIDQMPEIPNAYVPFEGMNDYNISMQILTEDIMNSFESVDYDFSK